VVLPVAVAAVLVFLAIVNMALVKAWKGQPEDGVLWAQSGANVVAREVDPGSTAALAGVRADDVLVAVDGREVATVADVRAVLRATSAGRTLQYVLQRQSEAVPLAVRVQMVPLVRTGLYFSVALVGILAIAAGASVRLRRPTDKATFHFFWLTVAFSCALAFTPSGLTTGWTISSTGPILAGRLLLPPLLLHCSCFRNGEPWRCRGPRICWRCSMPPRPLAAVRILLMTGRLSSINVSAGLAAIETWSQVYLAVCLIGGLAVMVRALTRLRSVTARRQLRWIVWGSALGALPFVSLYLVPFLFGRALGGAEYTAVLLGCIPLAFASAIVRYRLGDIEVIIKKATVAAAVVILLGLMYTGVSQLIGRLPGAAERESNFLALLATLLVALVAPWMWRAIQAGLDRLYYRDRYDYRRALLSFTRDLNSDLDLNRLSHRLVERIAETLGIDRIALFLPAPRGEGRQFTAYVAGGVALEAIRPIIPASALAARLRDGQTVVIDDPVPVRRLGGDESAAWRDAGFFSFVPCVSNDLTIAVIAAGRRAHGEPLSSEDMSLLAAVAGQAGTAIENARLYSQLQEKANEIEAVRQFNANVMESLTDALVVVDLHDRVLLWNRRAESLVGVERRRAIGQSIDGLFQKAFYDAIVAARRDAPTGASLFRVQLAPADERGRERLVDLAIAPLARPGEAQSGWILVIADVTDRATLEEQLRLSERMAPSACSPRASPMRSTRRSPAFRASPRCCSTDPIRPIPGKNSSRRSSSRRSVRPRSSATC
jgi:PAS domain S-box-containing protein